MTQTDATADHASLVPGAHRLIRAIDGKEGPFAGSLVTYEGGVAVCVPAERLADWPGWAYSGTEHVCGVLDIKRRPDGQDALLPWCTGRVEAFLGRRRIADAPLTAGELGTLVASALRGVRELGAEESESTGDWWLTGDGRPIFVHGEGGTARARTAHLVERSAQHTSDRATLRVLGDIAAAMRRPRHHVEDERRWEDELFAIAAPRALRLDVFAPEPAGEINAQRVINTTRSLQTRSTRLRSGVRTRPDRWHQRLIAMRERAADVLARLPRRERAATRDSADRRSPVEKSVTPSRRRALLLAGSLGATVLIVGMMWPSGETDDEAEAASLPSEVATEAPADTDQEQKSQGEVASDTVSDKEELTGQDAGVLAALPSVLVALHDCAKSGDTSCGDIVTTGAHMPSEGVVLMGSDASAAVLVEDYGDVAVVRLTPKAPEAIEQMMVLERQNERWLLRDVYDVAKQPA